MAVITKPHAGVPLVDPKTGVPTAVWYVVVERLVAEVNASQQKIAELEARLAAGGL